MKILKLLPLLLLFAFSTNAQENMWQDVNESAIVLSLDAEKQIPTNTYRSLHLDLEKMKSALNKAPLERLGLVPITLDLPLPDGTFRTFEVLESPVMQAGISAQYPQLKAFKITDVKNRQYSGRLSITPLGFDAIFQTKKGYSYVESYASNQSEFYTAYYRKDIINDQGDLGANWCGFEPMKEETVLENTTISNQIRDKNTVSEEVIMREYTLALACTGEYGVTHGNSVPAVMASFVTVINRVNMIFESEAAVRLVIMDGNDALIWLSPSTDPYIHPNDPRELIDENTDAITIDAGIPLADFDVGHVFTGTCPDGDNVVGIGQLASICGPNKARGVTCFYTNSLETIAIEVMAHEIGHQFSLAHTWANCPPSIGQLATGSAYEPGSGSTIMSYAGSCGSQNIQINADDYYHVRSLDQFFAFSREGQGSTCPTEVATSNTMPKITLDYENGFYIPISTPFELNGAAIDEQNDEMTYCWEQYDKHFEITPLGSPAGNVPTFRSYPPVNNSNRYFPRIQDIINNNSTLVEVLPEYSRDLTFRFTVRDNNSEGGGVVWSQVNFHATSDAGPFVVMTPNNGSEEWVEGAYNEVIWDVSNTDVAPVNCQFVNIRLSEDGGYTYPYMLAEHTLNTGSAFVTVPSGILSSQTRIRVEANNNVFFDISNDNFDVVAATAPSYTIVTTPLAQQVCLPAIIDVSIETASILDFSNTISLEVTEGLPENAVATFNTTDLAPGESATLSIDMTETNIQAEYDVVIRAVSVDADTSYRSIHLDLLANDFSDLGMTSPANGESGINLSTTFEWTPSSNALSYDIEIATSPAFGATVLESAADLTAPSFTNTLFFEENNLFFWRVRPKNSCGEGEWLEANAFHSINSECTTYSADGLPINISSSGTPTVESTLSITNSGSISEVIIPNIDVSYPPIHFLKVSVVSPTDTEVVLYDQACGNTTNLNIGFNDAAGEINCPPAGSLAKPVDLLSSFSGQNTQGDWKLRVKVVEAGFGSGSIDAWNIQFCATDEAINPTIITNETLLVAPGNFNYITNAHLEVQDADSDNLYAIQYMIVTPPSHGTVIFNDDEIWAGGVFRQSGVNASHVTYVHNGDDATTDSFSFVVTDGQGGWIPTQVFNINIDEDAVLGTKETLLATQIDIFPNPAKDVLTINLDKSITGDILFKLFNANGQEVLTQVANTSSTTLKINALPAGLYFLDVKTNKGSWVEKIVIE